MKKKWTRALALLCTLALALTLAMSALAEDIPPENTEAETDTSQDGETPATGQDAEPEMDADGFIRGTEYDTDYWWRLDENGTLTIKGTKMDRMNFTDPQLVPWSAQKEEIENVKVESGITNIGNFAFHNCVNLTNIEFPSSVTSIERSAFYGCSGLTNIELPSSVAFIGRSAFYGCSSLMSVEIPSGVTSIGEMAFFGCSSLTSIALPPSVDYIGSSTFYGCSGLTSIELPSSVTGIGSHAFWDCSSLTSIEIPSSMTSISYDAFDGCSSLQAITVEEGNSAYSSVDGILYTKDKTELLAVPDRIEGDITIPSTVSRINSYAFRNCGNLTTVTIPNSVTSIGQGAFSGCSSLINVTIPNSVTSIEQRTFSGCSSLTSITIPNSVTIIGPSAFRGCSSLTSVEIPSSVTEIRFGYSGIGPFGGCSNLQAIIVAEENPIYTSVDSVLYTKDQTKLLAVPNAIAGDLTISTNVTSIGEGAFDSCSGLTSISIPSSVTSIGYRAFWGCGNLNKVLFQGDAPRFLQAYDEPAGVPTAYRTFDGVEAIVFYPQNNDTWTEVIQQQSAEKDSSWYEEALREHCGGILTWVAYDPANPPDISSENPATPTEPDTPAQPEQPAQPDAPTDPATPSQILHDLAEQVIANGNYDLARQLLESLLNDNHIFIDARVTEAMRTAIEKVGGIGRGHQATENAYVYATYPQSFTEALQLARAEVNAAANSFTLDMSFPEGKQSPLGVYMTVYLKEAFDPALEYRWYCDDGSVGVASVEACDNNGYKACAKFYAPHFSTYTVQPVSSASASAPADTGATVDAAAPAAPSASTDPAGAPVLKSTGGDISCTIGAVLAFVAATVLGCAIVGKKKRKTL